MEADLFFCVAFQRVTVCQDCQQQVSIGDLYRPRAFHSAAIVAQSRYLSHPLLSEFELTMTEAVACGRWLLALEQFSVTDQVDGRRETWRGFATEFASLDSVSDQARSEAEAR